MLSGLVTGSAAVEQWGNQARAVDFYDLKGDLEAVLSLTGVSAEFGFQAAEHPSLHPGQAAMILRGEERLGWIGMLHPQIEQKLDLPGNLFLFELKIDGLLDGSARGVKNLGQRVARVLQRGQIQQTLCYTVSFIAILMIAFIWL